MVVVGSPLADHRGQIIKMLASAQLFAAPVSPTKCEGQLFTCRAISDLLAHLAQSSSACPRRFSYRFTGEWPNVGLYVDTTPPAAPWASRNCLGRASLSMWSMPE